MLEIKIHLASSSDLEELLNIAKTTFLETWEATNSKEDMAQYVKQNFTTESMAAELSDPHNRFYLAKAGNDLLGYAKLRTSKIPEQLQQTRCIEIERMYIFKAHKGQNVGSELMQRCLDYAQETNYETVWLGVWSENPAVRFYEKWGFHWFGFHIFVLGNDQQRDELMKKDLK